MKPNPYLVLSSFSFLAPAIVTYRVHRPNLTFLYITVWLVSSLYHATKNPSLVYIDYSTAQLTHAATVYYIIPGGYASMPYYFCWLFYALVIYYYGYQNQTLIWDPDLNKATPWHMSLHLSISIVTSYCVYATHRVNTSLAYGRTPF